MIEQFLTIFLVAIVLGADSLSLAVGIGLQGVSRSYELKFALLVGLFHVLMPIIGLNLGIVAGNILGVWASRLGAAVIIYLGCGMLWKVYNESRPQKYQFSQGQKLLASGAKPTDGWINLMLLTTSVSIDALAVGFSLGTMFDTPVLFTVLILGSVAGLMTLLGFQGGKLFSRVMGSYSQIVGGLVLLGLAVKMAL
jgi:putative Mn2+ efflux pump MntP